MVKLILRWILSLVFVAILLFIGVFFLAYHQQEKIKRVFIEQLNQGFSGHLTLAESRIHLFKNFPYVSLDLRQVAFYESKQQIENPIYRINDVYIGFDILELLRGNYAVKKILIEGGHIHLEIDEEKNYNIMIAKGIQNVQSDTSMQKSGEALQFELKQIVIKDFEVRKTDKLSLQETRLHFEKLKSSIQKSKKYLNVALDTQFTFDLLQSGEKTFLYDKNVIINSNFVFDKENEKLELLKASLSLQQAIFSASGYIIFNEELYANLRFNGQKPDFNLIFSLLPNEVAERLRDYQHSGRVFFEATVEGSLASGNTPAIEANFGCEDAFFQNNASKEKINDMQFKAYYTNGENHSLESSLLRIDNFYAKPAEGIFSANLLLKDFTDPYINVNLHSELDLRFVSSFFNLGPENMMTGKVSLQMNFNELVDLNMPQNQWSRLKEGVDSHLVIRDLQLKIPGVDIPFQKLNLDAEMQSGKVSLTNLSFVKGKTHMKLQGGINNLPAIFHKPDHKIEVAIAFESPKIYFDDFKKYQMADSLKSGDVVENARGSFFFYTSVNEIKQRYRLPKGVFSIESLSGDFSGYGHSLKNFKARIQVGHDTLTIEPAQFLWDRSDISLKGFVANYPLWFEDKKQGSTLVQTLITSDNLYVEDVLTVKGKKQLPKDYATEALRNFKGRAQLRLQYADGLNRAELTLQELRGGLSNHPFSMENLRGNLNWQHGSWEIEQFQCNLGRTQFEAHGFWSLQPEDANVTSPRYLDIRATYLDFDQLASYRPTEEKKHSEAFNIFEIPFKKSSFNLALDTFYYHGNEFKNFVTRIRTETDQQLFIDTLHIQFDRGTLGMNGHLNGSKKDSIYFRSEINVNELDLEALMFKIDQNGKDIVIKDNLQGKISGRISMAMEVHPDLTPKIDKGEVSMDIMIKEGVLVDFAPVMALSDLFKDRNLRRVRFDTLQNQLNLSNGILHIPAMTINSSLGFIEISGRQSLDLDMNYMIRIPLQLVSQVGFRTLFGGRNRSEVDPDQEDAIQFRDQNRRVRFINLTVSGRPDQYRVNMGRGRD
ncbi:MAG: AsmA family protein [Cyclobacteriaceae bacterium]|nr:AsmA family protein [Cyclobacteriaceae bacterium]